VFWESWTFCIIDFVLYVSNFRIWQNSPALFTSILSYHLNLWIHLMFKNNTLSCNAKKLFLNKRFLTTMPYARKVIMTNGALWYLELVVCNAFSLSHCHQPQNIKCSIHAFWTGMTFIVLELDVFMNTYIYNILLCMYGSISLYW